MAEVYKTMDQVVMKRDFPKKNLLKGHPGVVIETVTDGVRVKFNGRSNVIHISDPDVYLGKP